VLNNGDGTMHAFLAAEWAWVNQEMRKGIWPCLVPGNNEGGWGWNTTYRNNDGSYPLLPSAANVLTDDNIRTNSFFRWFDNDGLYGTNGSMLAQDWHLRAQLLGDGVPALSRAMGRNQLDLFANRNLNMNAKKNSWPLERLNSDLLDRWLHSDIKNVAYLFTYKVFDDIVRGKGGLQ
jgi:hypothetical protein